MILLAALLGCTQSPRVSGESNALRLCAAWASEGLPFAKAEIVQCDERHLTARFAAQVSIADDIRAALLDAGFTPERWDEIEGMTSASYRRGDERLALSIVAIPPQLLLVLTRSAR